MKLLAFCSSINLSEKGGGIPIWWQILKAFHEVEVEVVLFSCGRRSFNSPWWTSYEKPFVQSDAFDFAQNRGTVINRKLARRLYEWDWKRRLAKILSIEKDIDVALFLSVPFLSKGIPSWIRNKFEIPTVYYESDIQSLPEYSLDHRPEKHKMPDYSEYDALVCSFEKTSQIYREKGIQNVWTVPFGADPTIFTPSDVEQDIDIFFSGYGSLDREDWMRQMITLPSKTLKNVRFLVEGKFDVDLGNAKSVRAVSLDRYIHLCRRSKVNLNILRQQFVIGGVLNSRIFELASLGCCIVTNPCMVLDRFFEPVKELVVVKNGEESLKDYEWLLSSSEDRAKIGHAARQRILKEHTYVHRAKEFMRIFENLAGK